MLTWPDKKERQTLTKILEFIKENPELKIPIHKKLRDFLYKNITEDNISNRLIEDFEGYYFKQNTSRIYELTPFGEDFLQSHTIFPNYDITSWDNHYSVYIFLPKMSRYFVILGLRYHEIAQSIILPALRSQKLKIKSFFNNFPDEALDWQTLPSFEITTQNGITNNLNSVEYSFSEVTISFGKDFWGKLFSNINSAFYPDQVITHRIIRKIRDISPEVYIIHEQDSSIALIVQTIVSSSNLIPISIPISRFHNKFTLDKIRKTKNINKSIVIFSPQVKNKNKPDYPTDPNFLFAYGILQGQERMKVIAVMEPNVDQLGVVEDYVRLDQEGNWKLALKDKIK